MSQMPEIKPVINKEPEREKKKGGLLARLFGGGSEGSGFGGFGGAGGAGSGLASGGLLATKAGLMALILVGTTVAGGIGMVGYKLFGPGSSDGAGGGGGDNLQLFAPKPKEAQSADGAASKDGSSASLNFLSQANSTPKAPDAAAGEAPKDATAANATADTNKDAAASAGANGPINKMDGGGAGANKALKNVGKFGSLTGPSGGGGSGATASAAPQKSPTADASARSGTLSGFKKSGVTASAGGNRAALSSKHFGGAAGQGFGVLHDNKTAMSSAGGGTTYDGAKAGANDIGAGGTPIGMPGVTTGGGPSQPKSTPGPSTDTNSSSSIPSPDPTPQAPWQSQIQQAQMLIGLAGALLVAAALISKMTPYGPMISKIIGFAVSAIGALVIGIGAAIAHGKYAQTLQGNVLAAAGTGLVIAGLAAGLASNTDGSGGTPEPTDDDPDVGGTSAFDSSSGPSSGMFSGISPLILIGGGAAAVGLAATMMVPPTKYPAQDANDPNWPKGGLFGYQQQHQYPSEAAVKTMVA